jgi:hypothetical protein
VLHPVVPLGLEGTEAVTIGGLTLHDLEEASVVGPAAELHLDVLAVREGRLPVEDLLGLGSPGPLLRAGAVRLGRGPVLEAGYQDRVAVGGHPAGASEEADGPGRSASAATHREGPSPSCYGRSADG